MPCLSSRRILGLEFSTGHKLEVQRNHVWLWTNGDFASTNVDVADKTVFLRRLFWNKYLSAIHLRDELWSIVGRPHIFLLNEDYQRRGKSNFIWCYLIWQEELAHLLRHHLGMSWVYSVEKNVVACESQSRKKPYCREKKQTTVFTG